MRCNAELEGGLDDEAVVFGEVLQQALRNLFLSGLL